MVESPSLLIMKHKDIMVFLLSAEEPVKYVISYRRDHKSSFIIPIKSLLCFDTKDSS